VALLACPKADEPKAPAAAETAAPAAAAAAPAAAAATAPVYSADDVRALVAPVALYPDPLLAVVLQSSTQPLQVVGADRFLSQRQSDASLAPDPAWDPSVIALLNYSELVDMLSESLDWTEALGAATLDQLGDVQGAVQEIRFSSYNLGILRSNDVQEVLVRESVIAIVPKDPNQVSIPFYDGAELLAAIDQGESMGVTAAQAAAPAADEAAPAAAEAAPAGDVAEQAAAPAPSYATAPVYATPPPYAPPVSYSEPKSSFWTNAALFGGGAVVGGLLGYAIGDDDDDDDDNGGNYGWGGGGGNRYHSDDDIKINGDVIINGPVSVQRELNDRVRPEARPRASAERGNDRRTQSKALPRPAAPPASRPNVKPQHAPTPSVQLPKPAGKPSAVAAKRPPAPTPKPAAKAATATQTARRDNGGAFGDRPSPTKVAKESDRGARSRESAAKPAAAKAPRTGSKQLQKQQKQGKAGGLSREKAGGSKTKNDAKRGKQSRGKKG
jgi:hypothetical protein